MKVHSVCYTKKNRISVTENLVGKVSEEKERILIKISFSASLRMIASMLEIFTFLGILLLVGPLLWAL